MLIGTPIDLRRLIDFDRPALRVTYRLQEVGGADARRRARRARPHRARAGRRSRDGMTLVIALGGNALVRAGEQGTAAEQLAALRETFATLGPLVREGDVVITHGNGPQVGNELLRQERSADEVPPLPLWLAVAQTQAEIGALIESELAPAAGRPVACLLTHVLVDAGDEAFEQPTKPIGPLLQRRPGGGSGAGARLAARGGRGPRVPPRGLPASRSSSSTRFAPSSPAAPSRSRVAAVGFRSPRRDGKLKGIDAVIDKDRASALLARSSARRSDPHRGAGGVPRLRDGEPRRAA